MPTNVSPGFLNYHHYPNEKYDDHIRRSIPFHGMLHTEVESALASLREKKRPRVLELGVGTGLTAERVLKALPDAHYTGIDFSEHMLPGARRRLRRYDATLILGDYSRIELPKENDLVVSVISLHHQETDDDKRQMFGRIYDALAQDGMFLFGDLVTYRDPFEAALNDAKHYHHLVENATDEQSLREWAHHHKFLNRVAPVEDQLDWLAQAGFRQARLRWHAYNTALIVAQR